MVGVNCKKPPLKRAAFGDTDDGYDPLRGSRGDSFGDFIENFGPIFAGAGCGGLFVQGIAGDEGQGEGGFREDHLLVGEVDLAPGAGFLEC